MPIRPFATCRDIQQLIYAAQDRPLSWREKLYRQLHLKICGACAQVESNVGMLQKSLGKWRAYGNQDAGNDADKTR